jgi:hypothetical protein
VLQLQLSVTLGDLIVAGATVCAIIGAYFAVKGQLETTGARLAAQDQRSERIEKRVDVHDEDIGALEEKVYGRRKTDRRRKALEP